MRSSKMHKCRGFTLIEVLIAVVILSIGLLGIAGMQANSLKNNHLAFVKTQAANMAADLADRIRANPDQAAAYAGNYQALGDAPADPGCIDAACTFEQLADHDISQWARPFLREDKPVLPDGRAIVTRQLAAGVETITINILWRELNTEGMARFNCLEAMGGELEDDQACFQLSFRL